MGLTGGSQLVSRGGESKLGSDRHSCCYLQVRRPSAEELLLHVHWDGEQFLETDSERFADHVQFIDFEGRLACESAGEFAYVPSEFRCKPSEAFLCDEESVSNAGCCKFLCAAHIY